MIRTIYTYTDLTRLNVNPFISEIRKYPIITVSADLRKSLVGKMEVDRVDGLFQDDATVHVCAFNELTLAIDENWLSDQAKFNELIVLSEYIRGELEKASDKKEINRLTGCMRNIGSMHSSITLLEQAEVAPEDLDTDNDRNLELFVDAWSYLRENEPSIKRFHSIMNSLTTKERWNSVFRSAYKTNTSFDMYGKIVFFGFYYFTPQQERVMKFLEKAGYELLFLIPYDDRYPFVHEIWSQTYSVEKGYPDKSKWHVEPASKADVYGELFEGKEHVQLPNQLNIKEYASVMEFVDDIKKVKKSGISVYSSDFKAANKILKDYYPDEYGERKILSYPIGQFISTLNQMWDETRQTITLDEDSLIDCFSSGWLSLNGVSGRQYLKDLTYVLPFFTGSHTIKEWEDRIEQLKTIEEDIIKPFLVDLDPEESVSRWQEAIGNPLANFSMFAVETDKLDIILSLIKQLLEMAKKLFGANKAVRVSEHILKLDHILKQYEVSNELYAEERQIVGDIFEKLGSTSDFDAKCAPTDIARALGIFMSGRFDDGEIQTNRIGMVYPMFFIDAACVKNKSKVHICMCDVNAMPGGNKEYVWPLTTKIVKKCYEKTKNSLIINIMDIMESTALCNRYFMYNALKNKEVTISWISNINDKLLAPSPYIKLICDASGIELKPAKRASITFDRVADAAYGTGKIAEYDNSRTPAGMIKEARMAYAMCPMKYTLGYVVEKFPTYQSEFQQNYALNALISAIYNLMKDSGVTINQVYKNVMDLFPSLRKVEKRQVYDYIKYDRRENDMDYGICTECGGNYYTDERLKLHYPNQQVREAAIGRFGKLMTPDGRKGMNLYEVMEATNDEEVYGRKDVIKSACIFCPHISYCRNALYAGDQETYYD